MGRGNISPSPAGSWPHTKKLFSGELALFPWQHVVCLGWQLSAVFRFDLLSHLPCFSLHRYPTLSQGAEMIGYSCPGTPFPSPVLQNEDSVDF